MSNVIRSVAAAAALACLAPVASAQSFTLKVLTFDDLSGVGYFGSPYKGFKFGDLVSPFGNTWFASNDVSDPNYRAKSPSTTIATNECALTCFSPKITYGAGTFSDDFLMYTAFVSGPTRVGGKLNKVGMDLYNDGVLVHKSARVALTPAPKRLNSGWAGEVDQVIFTGRGGFYVVDNLKVGVPDVIVTTAVPEPSTYAMLALGLAGVGFIARRRRAQS